MKQEGGKDNMIPKEVTDSFLKVLDNAVYFVARALDAGPWKKDAASTTELSKGK